MRAAYVRVAGEYGLNARWVRIGSCCMHCHAVAFAEDADEKFEDAYVRARGDERTLDREEREWM